jgi:hypothetical protein
MLLSPTTRHFIPLRSKYSPKHPVFKYPQCSTVGKWLPPEIVITTQLKTEISLQPAMCSVWSHTEQRFIIIKLAQFVNFKSQDSLHFFYHKSWPKRVEM